MKSSELIYLFNIEFNITKNKYKNDPSLKYIIRSYNNVFDELYKLSKIHNSITLSTINNLTITDNMKNKLNKLISTKLSKADVSKVKEYQLHINLTDLLGVSSTKATLLIKNGLTSINDLNQTKWKKYLNKDTLTLLSIPNIFSNEKSGISKDISYNYVKSIEKKVIEFKLATVILVGGFIRKKPFSKDIDIMLVNDSKKLDIFDEFILHLKSIFKELYVYMRGNDKMSIIVRGLKSYKDTFHKIDVFKTDAEHKYAMLLYLTGSKTFNIKMRSIAKKKGYILNQNGLFKLENVGNKVTPKSKPIKVFSEHDYFKLLNMNYIRPDER